MHSFAKKLLSQFALLVPVDPISLIQDLHPILHCWDTTTAMSSVEVTASYISSGILESETTFSDDSVSESQDRRTSSTRTPMTASSHLFSSDKNGHHSLHHQESYETHMHYDATPSLQNNNGVSSSSPYRHEELEQFLHAANQAETVEERRRANQKTMEALANMGVSVFLISYECDNMWKEVKHCIMEVSSMAIYNCSTDKCLLDEDDKGRLYNLQVAGDFTSLTNSYDSMLDKASGVEAICAFVVLVRAFACVGKWKCVRVNVTRVFWFGLVWFGLSLFTPSPLVCLFSLPLLSFSIELRNGIKPAYIALILGLVLTEELSNVWINTSMLVMGTPSISAFTLTHPVTIDWPKQVALLLLSIAAVIEDDTLVRHVLTLIGIGWACAVIVVNVGSKAWHHLKLPPLSYRGPFRNTGMAFCVATLVGLGIPYIGFRHAQPGGQVALETVIVGAFLVALVFGISDFDKVQAFVVAGSEVSVYCMVCVCVSLCARVSGGIV